MACSISSWSGLASILSSSCVTSAGRGPTAPEMGLECPVKNYKNLSIPPMISQVIFGYHDMIIDIPGYFGIISHVIFKFETSNQVKLEYLILNTHTR